MEVIFFTDFWTANFSSYVEDHPEFLQWCEDNHVLLYYHDNGFAVTGFVENEADIIAFKLRWC